MQPRQFVTRRQFISASAGGDEANRSANAAPSSTADNGYLVRFARQAMAADFQVFLVAGRDDLGSEAALAALDLVDTIETQLTIYRDTSEVLEINRRAAD